MPTNHIMAPVWGIWILTPLNSHHDDCSVVCRIGPYHAGRQKARTLPMPVQLSPTCQLNGPYHTIENRAITVPMPA